MAFNTSSFNRYAGTGTLQYNLENSNGNPDLPKTGLAPNYSTGCYNGFDRADADQAKFYVSKYGKNPSSHFRFT